MQFEFTNGFEMMHKAWCTTEEVSCCFFRSSIKFEGHMDKKNQWIESNFKQNYKAGRSYQIPQICLVFSENV